MIKILIADDHAMVRRGLVQILLECFPEAIFGQASDAKEALQKVREQCRIAGFLKKSWLPRNCL